MATYSKQLLSGSTSGKQIKVVATGTPGTLIHTAHASALDEIHIWAQNSDAADRLLTIEWGEATAPDGNVQQTIPLKSGWNKVVDGLILTGGLTVKAFAAAGNVITLGGFVNRVT